MHSEPEHNQNSKGRLRIRATCSIHLGNNSIGSRSDTLSPYYFFPNKER